MSTAQEVLNTSLERAGVIQVGATPTNAYSVRALELLNDWIAEKKTDGVDLQLSALALSDTVYLDASDMAAVKANLTVLIADQWKLPISPDVRQRAIDLLENVRGKYLEADLEEMELPDLLVSSGSGNIISGT